MRRLLTLGDSTRTTRKEIVAKGNDEAQLEFNMRNTRVKI